MLPVQVQAQEKGRKNFLCIYYTFIFVIKLSNQQLFQHESQNYL